MRLLAVASVVTVLVSIFWNVVIAVAPKGGEGWLPPEQPWQRLVRTGLTWLAIAIAAVGGVLLLIVLVSGILRTM